MANLGMKFETKHQVFYNEMSMAYNCTQGHVDRVGLILGVIGVLLMLKR